jgi:hypothetical protein
MVDHAARRLRRRCRVPGLARRHLGRPVGHVHGLRAIAALLVGSRARSLDGESAVPISGVRRACQRVGASVSLSIKPRCLQATASSHVLGARPAGPTLRNSLGITREKPSNRCAEATDPAPFNTPQPRAGASPDCDRGAGDSKANLNQTRHHLSPVHYRSAANYLEPGYNQGASRSARDHWSRADDRPTTFRVAGTLARASNRNDPPSLGALKPPIPALLWCGSNARPVAFGSSSLNRCTKERHARVFVGELGRYSHRNALDGLQFG